MYPRQNTDSRIPNEKIDQLEFRKTSSCNQQMMAHKESFCSDVC